ncbi:MAG: cation diffusion facilitator family transporter [Tepidisphaera sp.]|nr:cation diffusion facilitator family transporter [Tepidisphaera sp.]
MRRSRTSRLFCPGTLAHMDSRRLEINTLVGMAASIALCLAKFLAGWLGHSSALIADGVESLADTVGSVVVWRGLRLASKPPDETHPYGYGKAEALAALGVGALLLGAAAFIVIESFNKLLSPHPPPEPWTLAIIAAVIVVKETLFRVTIDGARKTDSDAARADAWHHRADSITSAAAFIGVSIAVAGPRWFAAPRLVFADEVAAMVASGVIVITGFSLGLPALRELLDAASPELANTVRATAGSVPGVRLVEKVETRKSGRGYLVDMHLHVDPAMSVHDAHALAGLVKATIRREHANVGRVLIHVEPCEQTEK